MNNPFIKATTKKLYSFVSPSNSITNFPLLWVKLLLGAQK